MSYATDLLERILTVTIPNFGTNTNVQLENGLSYAQRNALNYMKPLNTTLTGDDAICRLVNRTTLTTASKLFGNTNRFTDSSGVLFNDNNSRYCIDNATGLGWYSRIVSTAHNYATSTTDAAALTYTDPVLGALSGFRIPYLEEWMGLGSYTGQIISSSFPNNGFGSVGTAQKAWSQSTTNSGTNYLTPLNTVGLPIQSTTAVTTASMNLIVCRQHV